MSALFNKGSPDSGATLTTLLSDPSDSRNPWRSLLIYLFTRPSSFTLQGLLLPVCTSFQTMDLAVAPVRWAMVSPHWLQPFYRLMRPPGATALGRWKPISKGKPVGIQKMPLPWTPRRYENWRCLQMTSRYGGSNWVSIAAISQKKRWNHPKLFNF